MKDEYIRKQGAVDAFNRAVQDVEILDADDIETVFGMLSSADVAPVVHGEWIHMGCGVFECDKCGERISTNVYVKEKASARFKFCPSCGANMIGEQE